MRIYYFLTKQYEEHILKQSNQKISLNYRNLTQLYLALNSNNLITRYDAKFCLKIYKELIKDRKIIEWHGLPVDKQEKINKLLELNQFNGKDKKMEKASTTPDWFNTSIMSKTVTHKTKDNTLKIAKDIIKNKTLQEETTYLIPWVYK